MTTAAKPTRRPRSDGERSRAAILHAASQLATVEGLDGLSIARLADHIGMSKSGVYAHFDSKQDLQLATVAAAHAVFGAEVLAPALEAPEGLPRLEQLCDRFLSHIERGVFPGGCFFASTAAELDTRPGPVRDSVAAIYGDWLQLIEEQVRQAQTQGNLDRDADPAQLTFEIDALLSEANGHFLLRHDTAAFGRARRGIRDRLESARQAA